MQIRLADNLTYDSIVDGLGLRIVIWTQGCLHNCPFCHNPSTHPLDKGFLKDIDEVVDEVVNYKLKSGVTISGGDPFYQKESLLELVKKLNLNSVNIWVYTGFNYEQLINDPTCKEILTYINVLVDGLFINNLKSDKLRFKGSSNQRIIDIQETLKEGKIIELPL